jgi:hypothetical protein
VAIHGAYYLAISQPQKMKQKIVASYFVKLVIELK